jgi:hypothetical protein
MAAHIVGGHPYHNRPARVCGTFSFKGNSKDLYYIWTLPGGFTVGAWIRSVVLGTAIITFHPAAAINHNGVMQYHVWLHIALVAVPHYNAFRIEHMGHIIPPHNNFAYHLIFGPSYTFFIANQPWEIWRPQLQMWRKALTGAIPDHNIR